MEMVKATDSELSLLSARDSGNLPEARLGISLVQVLCSFLSGLRRFPANIVPYSRPPVAAYSKAALRFLCWVTRWLVAMLPVRLVSHSSIPGEWGHCTRS